MRWRPCPLKFRIWRMAGSGGKFDRRRSLETAVSAVCRPSDCGSGGLPARLCDRLHRPGASGRVEAGRRHHRHHGLHRRRLCTADPEAGLGAARQVKRFWKEAEVVEADGGFGIALDGRRVKTPGRADLIVPTRALAEAIAAEWRDCGETVDPRALPLTGLANAALERVTPDRQAFAAGLVRYAESDLTCYRAEAPAALVARQTESWDALLAWARRR